MSSGFTSEKNLKSVSDFHDKTTIILNHGIIGGMSLKNCNNVILAEAPSSPEIYAQAISRVRRHDSHISVPSYVNSYLLVSTISKTTMKQKKIKSGIDELRSGLIKYLNLESAHTNDPSTPDHAKKAIVLVITAASLLYAPRDTYLSLRKRLLGLAIARLFSPRWPVFLSDWVVR